MNTAFTVRENPYRVAIYALLPLAISFALLAYLNGFPGIGQVYNEYKILIWVYLAYSLVRLNAEYSRSVFSVNGERITLTQVNGWGKFDEKFILSIEDIAKVSADGAALQVILRSGKTVTLSHLQSSQRSKVLTYLSEYIVEAEYAQNLNETESFCIRMPWWDILIKSAYGPILVGMAIYILRQEYPVYDPAFLSAAPFLVWILYGSIINAYFLRKRRFIFESDGHLVYQNRRQTIVAVPARTITEFKAGDMITSHILFSYFGVDLTTSYLRARDIKYLKYLFNKTPQTITLMTNWNRFFQAGAIAGCLFFLAYLIFAGDHLGRGIFLSGLVIVAIAILSASLVQSIIVKEEEGKLSVYSNGKFVEASISDIACFTTAGEKGGRFILENGESITLSTKWIASEDIRLLEQRFPAAPIKA